MEGLIVEADLPMEAVEDNEMPDLIETVNINLATLSGEVQNGGIPSSDEQFNVVSILC